ncbi:MAG: VOC family protein [Rhodospirillaceae bacterium]|jgi:catechol 2,3-dioxygenase|nr:VOC family protein [Rhodospirillaceae bacterium]MBT5195320.1 VOC family protein [Rhodospirillaceae bacterium]MBT5898365.1 VOC family protein [Rhodospirillaceae bacterium]MBT6427424.1 VOC family protein [Rhodospirillaceae bacterium]MBT7756181.1 VOC family protein [Rhodospirillaceae bacterium]
MIKPQLTHVGIYVKDMDRMLQFYSDVFGLTLTDAGRPPDFHLNIAFLSANPGEHHQMVLVGGREDDATANVAQQISFLVASLDEVREMRDKVVAAGLEVRRVITHGNAWSVYFSDPEDNTLEVYAHTPWYIPQPAAIPFDLDLSNDEIMAQTEELCRANNGFATAEARQATMREMMDS